MLEKIYNPAEFDLTTEEGVFDSLIKDVEKLDDFNRNILAVKQFYNRRNSVMPEWYRKVQNAAKSYLITKGLIELEK